MAESSTVRSVRDKKADNDLSDDTKGLVQRVCKELAVDRNSLSMNLVCPPAKRLAVLAGNRLK